MNSEVCSGDLSGKKIILGITGSIAAYKAAYLASALVKRGADITVVMTEHATKLIGEATFWSITRNPVITDMFKSPESKEILHVSLPQSADLLLIAPATANIIAKLANGIADDMLSTMALAATCPMMIAPAMNIHMYRNPVTVANIEKLRGYGYTFVEPESGWLACGDEGVGRLAEPEEIVKAVENVLLGRPGDYRGVKVMVTAGPTQEPIDPVRFISNRSSGKMGYAIAEQAVKRGASVILVTGPTELAPPAGVEVVQVTTVKEMREVVQSRIEDMNVFIAAAAPADFTPSKVWEQKIKKTEHLTLELKKTTDILAEVGKNKGNKVHVGFAAETEKLEEYAEAKLKNKNLDVIVANDVSSGEVFGSDSNQVTLISRMGDKVKWPRMSKREVANGILDYIKKNFLEESF